MKMRGAAILLALAAVAVGTWPQLTLGQGSGQQLVVASWGGPYQAAQRDFFFGPFERETGIHVVDVSEASQSPAKIRTMADANRMEWDVSDVTANQFFPLVERALLEPLDFTGIATRDFVPAAVHKYGLGSVFFSRGLAYRSDVYRLHQPQSWKDFWDVRRFPGPRAMTDALWFSHPDLEMALCADGVPVDKIYPIDVERAFRKLAEIKPNVTVWLKSGAQQTQLIQQKEVFMSVAGAAAVELMRQRNVPVAYSWNCALLELDYWVVPKNAPHRAAAMRFVKFAADAQRQAQFAAKTAWGPTNLKSFRFIDSARAREIPTSPENLKLEVVSNAAWWVANQERVVNRWNEWIRQ